jgi:CRISPR-associated protein Csm5
MKFLNTARIALTPLSPIHIGCGEDFEPTNYVIEEGVLYGFDPSRAALPDPLRQKLMQLGNSADLLGIQRFFRDQRDLFIPQANVLMPVAKGIAEDYEDKIGKVVQREPSKRDVINALTIERGSHTGGQPYIPGSSFKGAMRTPVVDKLNNGARITDRDEQRNSGKLEKRLLQGDFATSPLRLLKVADLMPVGDIARQVLFAVNRKKTLVIDKQTGQERQPRGITARKECIAPGQFRALMADVTLPQVEPHDDPKTTPVARLRPHDLRDLAMQCNRYYLPRLQAELRGMDARGMVRPDWKQTIETLLAGELKSKLEHGEAFLIRLGRYGGAESKTLSGEGIAQIKIMQGQGKPAIYQSNTLTYWLAASNANEQKHLLPFGWALVEIDPQGDLPQLKAWCEAEGKKRPDMGAIQAKHAEAKMAAHAEKERMAAEKAAQAAAAEAERAAQADKAARLAALSPQMQQLDALREKLQDRIGQKKQAVGGEIYGWLQAALKMAAAPDWQAEDRQALLALINEYGPQLILLDAKELRKKLKPLIDALQLG